MFGCFFNRYQDTLVLYRITYFLKVIWYQEQNNDVLVSLQNSWGFPLFSSKNSIKFNQGEYKVVYLHQVSCL